MAWAFVPDMAIARKDSGCDQQQIAKYPLTHVVRLKPGPQAPPPPCQTHSPFGHVQSFWFHAFCLSYRWGCTEIMHQRHEPTVKWQ